MSEKKGKKRNSETGPIGILLLGGLFVLPLTHWIAPDFLPLGMADLWSNHDTGLRDWAMALVPGVVWGLALQGLVSALRDPPPRGHRIDPPKYALATTFLSLYAGVVEECAYRWVLFLSCMPAIYIIDQASFGLLQSLHVGVIFPLMDLTTGGLLTEWLHHESGWLVGAGIFSANSGFRDGHKYQGFGGWVNSWFMGLYFFWLALNYGLAVAVVGHTLYNLVVYAVSGTMLHLRHRPALEEECSPHEALALGEAWDDSALP